MSSLNRTQVLTATQLYNDYQRLGPEQQKSFLTRLFSDVTNNYVPAAKVEVLPASSSRFSVSNLNRQPASISEDEADQLTNEISQALMNSRAASPRSSPKSSPSKTNQYTALVSPSKSVNRSRLSGTRENVINSIRRQMSSGSVSPVDLDEEEEFVPTRNTTLRTAPAASRTSPVRSQKISPVKSVSRVSNLKTSPSKSSDREVKKTTTSSVGGLKKTVVKVSSLKSSNGRKNTYGLDDDSE